MNHGGSNNSKTKHQQQQLHTVTVQKEAAIELVPYVFGCTLCMQIIYMTLRYIYNNGYTSMIGLPPPLPEMCANSTDNEKCGRSDLFAFQSISLLVFTYCGSKSFYIWHITDTISTIPKEIKIKEKTDNNNNNVNTSAEIRLYWNVNGADGITVVNLAYQIWDFIVSITIPEFCTVIMMTHHLVAGIVAASAIYANSMGTYYAIFFLGLSEVSSIFLVGLDFSKYFQLHTGSILELLIEKIAAPLFVICFIYYRVIQWWPISYQLYKDVIEVRSNNNNNNNNNGRIELRPGKSWTLYLWLSLCLPMGILQLYWLTLILAEVKVVIAAE